jgi:hypothetical protein
MAGGNLERKRRGKRIGMTNRDPSSIWDQKAVPSKGLAMPSGQYGTYASLAISGRQSNKHIVQLEI